MSKINLLMETLQWLEELDYSTNTIPLDLFDSPTVDVKRVKSFTTSDDNLLVDETFIRDTSDIDLDRARRLIKKWQKWVSSRKVCVITHDEKKPFVISKGMQLARIPAWRNFLLLTRGIKHWHRYTVARQQSRKESILKKKPKFIQKKYRQSMMFKFWLIWTRQRKHIRKRTFRVWQRHIASHTPVKNVRYFSIAPPYIATTRLPYFFICRCIIN